MFGIGKKKQKIDDLEIRFHREAGAHGSHGKIKVSSRRLGLDNKVVNFVFVGMKEPPPLTPSLVNYVWEEAKAQGFLPHEFVGMLEVNSPPEIPAAPPSDLTHGGRYAPIPESLRLPGGATLMVTGADLNEGHQTAGFADAAQQAAALETEHN